MLSRKSRLVSSTMLSSVLVLGLLAAGAAHAQDTSVEEVVVTAQKTAQNIQNVPIAITAVTAKMLETKGIDDVSKLSAIAPNVTLDAGTPFSGSGTVLAAYIRGIGQNDFAFNQDPGVGVYIDGVYLARSVGSNTTMLDVDRVEILKGPQGTLFGRNTIGGAISIVTRDPGSDFMFKGEVTTGQFSRLDVQMTADLPINDKVLTSVSFSEAHRNGWQHRIPFTPVNLAPFTTSAGPFSYVPDCGAVGATCAIVYDRSEQFPSAGYQSSDRPGGIDQWSARGKIVLLPSADVKVTVTGDYSHINQSASANTAINIDPNAAALGGLYNACISVPAGLVSLVCDLPRMNVSPVPTPVAPLPAIGGANVDGNPNNNRLPWDSRFETHNPDFTYETGNSFSKLENWGVAGTIDWTLGDAMLKSITAYRKLHWRSGMDLDGSPLSILEPSFDMPQHEFSEELQLTGKTFDDRLQYILGAYYFNESGHLHDYVIFPGGLLMIDGPNDLWTKATAVYAHLDFKVTDQVSLIAGGRYTWERKRFEGHQTDDNGLAYKASGCYPPSAFIFSPTADCQQVLGFPNPSEPYRYYPAGIQHLDFNNFSPTLGIEFHPTQDVMVYGTFSKGFKTGSWTTRLSNPHPTYDSSLHFDPEKATSEEVGIKSELMDHRVRLNLAGFHTDYKNIQLNSQIGISPTLVNAGDARIWGAEAETEILLGGGFSLQGAIGYIDAKYTRIANGVGDNGYFLTLNSCPAREPAGSPNRVNGVQNGACNLPKTPKWKTYVGPQYVADLGSMGQLQFNLDWTHTTTLYNDLGNTFELKRPTLDLLNASVTYRAPGGHWEASVGGTNLTNERYITSGQWQGGASVVDGVFSDPLEWYATVRVRY
ncbi:MAG: TonB-dependent receptor [Caulobacteraceae bacterium]